MQDKYLIKAQVMAQVLALADVHKDDPKWINLPLDAKEKANQLKPFKGYYVDVGIGHSHLERVGLMKVTDKDVQLDVPMYEINTPANERIFSVPLGCVTRIRHNALDLS